MTTYYVGNHYEVKNSVVTKYYFAGATRLAVRTNGTLSYLLGDHLGSSSVTTNASGIKTAQALYKAFGETRFSFGALGTDYKFTGQREEASLGLYFFQSRWFDPSLGRFTSPDTIVPTGTQGTQAWDRYAFVNNNPVRYNDPTGHQTDSTNDKGSTRGCDNNVADCDQSQCHDPNATNNGQEGTCTYPASTLEDIVPPPPPSNPNAASSDEVIDTLVTIAVIAATAALVAALIWVFAPAIVAFLTVGIATMPVGGAIAMGLTAYGLTGASLASAALVVGTLSAAIAGFAGATAYYLDRQNGY